MILFREGFESFLTVAIILTYLRKTGRDSLRPAVYWAVACSIAASVGLGLLLADAFLQLGNHCESSLIERYVNRASSRSGRRRKRQPDLELAARTRPVA